MSIVTDEYRGARECVLAYCEMVNAARYAGTTTYQTIAQIMGLPLQGNYMANEVGKVIGAISEDEHNHGRPMLSAIVVNVNGRPGGGFFDLPRKLGRLAGQSKEAEDRFWDKEKAAVYETWRREFKV